MACVLASCGEYNKVMKSSDLEYKYAYAKKAFENKRYAQAYTILTDLVPVFRGTPHAEESLYLLALSYSLSAWTVCRVGAFLCGLWFLSRLS